jgi:hypothetical protein
MNILLTVDLQHPASPERNSIELLLRSLWDQLQVLSFPTLDLLAQPPREMSISEWAQLLSLDNRTEHYSPLARIPLQDYDLVIGCSLRPEVEDFFTSLGVRCLTVRTVPCSAFQQFLLVRANFNIPTEYSIELPSVTHLYQQNIPFVDIPSEERGWWLANRFLINQKSCYKKTLFIGTTIFQPERIVGHQVTNLITYSDEIKKILLASPAPFYIAGQPSDCEEMRFMRAIGVTFPCLPLPLLLARKEFDQIVSIDSGLVPVAKAFQKKIRILGESRSWSVIQSRQFRNRDFFEKIFQEPTPSS